MWSRYDGAVVREELAVLAAHGLDVTRSFCFWPDFVPEPERLDEDVAARFADFLDAHLEPGMRTIPTFLVGHMSGENWDPAWRDGRDLYRDVWIVSQQAWFAAEIARSFGDHPAVSGWLVSNEMPLYGGPGHDRRGRRLGADRRAGRPCRRGDPADLARRRGVGARDRPARTTGTRCAPSRRSSTSSGRTRTRCRTTRCASSSRLRSRVSSRARFGLPVVLEEFGVSSDFASDENAAAYYRQVLHTTLLAGARGWLAWNNCDYDDIRDEHPYRHHVFELHFGLIDASGKPKRPAARAARVRASSPQLPSDGWEPVRGDAAMVVPEHFERAFPFTDPAYRRDIREGLLQAYVAAREADLPVSLDRERDGLADRRAAATSPRARSC